MMNKPIKGGLPTDSRQTKNSYNVSENNTRAGQRVIVEVASDTCGVRSFDGVQMKLTSEQ